MLFQRFLQYIDDLFPHVKPVFRNVVLFIDRSQFIIQNLYERFDHLVRFRFLKGTVPSLYCVKTREQAEAGMQEFIHNYLLDDEPLICVFSEGYISCEDKDEQYVFTARLTEVNNNPLNLKPQDPYHLHPLPLYDVCVEALERGFNTIYDSRTLLHTPLNEFAEDIDARNYDDAYGYVRFGPIIIGLTDAWETEAEIYELDGI